MNIDNQLFYFLNGFSGKNLAVDGVIIFFASYLEYLLVLFFVAYVFFALREKRARAAAIALAFGASVVSRFAIVPVIRFFYHRPRPFVDLGGVNKLVLENSYSFPSGHASFFFAFSTVAYFYNKKLGIFFYAASLLMCASRVAAGVHYPSDILGGALLGILCGWAAVKISQNIARKAPNVGA